MVMIQQSIGGGYIRLSLSEGRNLSYRSAIRLIGSASSQLRLNRTPRVDQRGRRCCEDRGVAFLDLRDYDRHGVSALSLTAHSPVHCGHRSKSRELARTENDLIALFPHLGDQSLAWVDYTRKPNTSEGVSQRPAHAPQMSDTERTCAPARRTRRTTLHDSLSWGIYVPHFDILVFTEGLEYMLPRYSHEAET